MRDSSSLSRIARFGPTCSWLPRRNGAKRIVMGRLTAVRGTARAYHNVPHHVRTVSSRLVPPYRTTSRRVHSLYICTEGFFGGSRCVCVVFPRSTRRSLSGGCRRSLPRKATAAAGALAFTSAWGCLASPWLHWACLDLTCLALRWCAFAHLCLAGLGLA